MGPVLPFTAEVMDSLVGRYNLAIWPLPVLTPILAVAAVGLAIGPLPGGGRMIAGLLAAAWAWVGVAFQIRTAGQIDFMAAVYGAFSIAQAVLLLWSGALRDSLTPGLRRDVAGLTGLTLAAVGIAGYPLATLLAGRNWPEMPLVGLAPDPTAMLTLGLLLATGSARLHLIAVPVLWSAVAGMQALSLGTPERLILPVAAILTTILAVQARRGATL